MKNPRPLKRFGQNYLTDRNTVQKIVAQFDPQPDDIVIEIGPGSGALTSLLHTRVKKLTAIEIDRRVIENLQNEYPGVHFINGDFLEMELHLAENSEEIRFIGNIPYNITSPILFRLIEMRNIVNDATLMVQYEVAKRICSKPNTKDYGILGVLCSFFTVPKLCFKIPPTVFYPRPKVDSAIIQLKFQHHLPADVDPKLFMKVVKAAFGNRRKTLKNSLSNSIFSDISFSDAEFDFTRRAEQLDLDQFLELTKLISNKLIRPA